jgi:hypothetical protein
MIGLCNDKLDREETAVEGRTAQDRKFSGHHVGHSTVPGSYSPDRTEQQRQDHHCRSIGARPWPRPIGPHPDGTRLFGSDPAAANRIKIIATITDFEPEDAGAHTEWFRDGRGVPYWFDPATSTVLPEKTHDGQRLACEIISILEDHEVLDQHLVHAADRLEGVEIVLARLELDVAGFAGAPGGERMDALAGREWRQQGWPVPALPCPT